MKLRNRYLAIIYKGVITRKTTKQIHKELYDATINKKVYSRALFAYATKLANRAKKLDNNEKRQDLAVLLIPKLTKNNTNKIINIELRKMESKQKKQIIKTFVEENRKQGKYFYLASSHDDCAKDHLPYQGKIYIDEKAPPEHRLKGYKTLQWVIDAPAYFITRPNCRHYFVSMEKPSDAKNINAHSKEGDRFFQTPRKQAIEAYKERLATLKTLYAQYPNERLKLLIEKTELLLKKWQNMV